MCCSSNSVKSISDIQIFTDFNFLKMSASLGHFEPGILDQITPQLMFRPKISSYG
jgi:hypothetical protein